MFVYSLCPKASIHLVTLLPRPLELSPHYQTMGTVTPLVYTQCDKMHALVHAIYAQVMYRRRLYFIVHINIGKNFAYPHYIYASH